MPARKRERGDGVGPGACSGQEAETEHPARESSGRKKNPRIDPKASPWFERPTVPSPALQPPKVLCENLRFSSLLLLISNGHGEGGWYLVFEATDAVTELVAKGQRGAPPGRGVDDRRHLGQEAGHRVEGPPVRAEAV